MEDDGHRNPQGKPEKGEPARGTHMHNAHASCLYSLYTMGYR